MILSFGLLTALPGCSGGTNKSAAAPAPSIASVSPLTGPVGASVTLTGTNFGPSQGTSTVTFNGTSAGTASSWSATSIAVTVPSGATTGNVVVTVGGQVSNGVSFTVTLPAPSITSLSPTSGPVGTSVTITGTNFGSSQGSSAVTFNGTAAGTASSWSATSITATVPSGAATGNVIVTVGGQASNGMLFTVSPAVASECGSGLESLLNGSYVFLLKGFDSSGNPALLIGALTFDGAGAVVAGSIDMNLDTGLTSLPVSSGTYTVGDDQRGCIAVATSAATLNYRFSAGGISGGVASTGHMIGFDTAGPFTTGILRKQSGGPFSNASVNGSYAFGGSSLQNSEVCASPCKAGTIGVISFNGNGGVTGGSQDFNGNGTLDGSAANTTWPASPIPIDNGGSYSAPSANGRSALTYSVGGGSSSSSLVVYLVSPEELFFMTSDPQKTSTVVAGTALLQSGTPFAANPLSGTYIGYDSGTGGTSLGRTDLYLLGPLTSGNGALAGVQYRNTGGSFTSGSLAGAAYSVSSDGRSVFSAGTSIFSNNGGHVPLLYLVSATQAFFLQSNPSVDAGFFEQQSGGPFSESSAAGTYAFGLVDPELASNGAFSGVATFASNGFSSTLDAIGNGISEIGQQQPSATYSIDGTGLGLTPSGCSISVTPVTCDSAFYVISPTEAVLMDVQSAHPKIQTANH